MEKKENILKSCGIIYPYDTPITEVQVSDKIKNHSKKLLSIKSFRKQLKYYNENICSLSYDFLNEYVDLQSCGFYDNNIGVGETFFNFREYSKKHVAIYEEERDLELTKLKNALNLYEIPYQDRLYYLLRNRSGPVRFDNLSAFSSVDYYFYGEARLEIPVFNLNPKTESEYLTYNELIMNFARRTKDDPAYCNGMVKYTYPGCRHEVELQNLEKEKQGSLYPKKIIQYWIDTIESEYQIQENYEYKSILADCELFVTNRKKWVNALFRALVNGYEFDYSKITLNLSLCYIMIHVEEVFKLYKKLLLIGKTHHIYTQFNTNEKSESLSIRAIVVICRCKGIEIMKQINLDITEMFSFTGSWEKLYQRFNSLRNDGVGNICNINKNEQLLASIRNFLSSDPIALAKFESEVNKQN